jgi:hypothetical protein
MALCHFCGRIDFRNGQAVRAHLRWCEPYQQRAVNETIYQRWRSLQGPRGSPAAEARLRERFEARRGRHPRQALCAFCQRLFRNTQAVRARPTRPGPAKRWARARRRAPR